MKNIIKTTLFLVVASFAASSQLFSGAPAPVVATDPVGYVTTEVNSGADTKAGITLHQTPTMIARVGSVSTGVVTFESTVPDVTTNTHYALVTSDNGLQGRWFEIIASNSSSVTVAENLQSAGLTSADTLSLIPFWTLDTLFPEGGDIPASSNVTDPAAQVLLNDVSGIGINLSSSVSYLYHSGEQGPAGWYDVNDIGGGLVGSDPITPESYITIRNDTQTAISVVVAGTVPETTANTVLSRSVGAQDSQIANPYPAGIMLAESNLILDSVIRPSSDVSNPLDQLLIFEGTPTGKNPSPTKSVIYHSGEQGPAGWYDANNIGEGLIDAYEIPAGAALVVRRAAGSDEVITWAPPTPYSL